MLDIVKIFYDGQGNLYLNKPNKAGSHHTCIEVHYFFCNKEFDKTTNSVILFSILKKTKLKEFELICSRQPDPVITGT